MSRPEPAPCRGLRFVAAVVLLALLVGCAAPASCALTPVVGPVAVALADVLPATRLHTQRPCAPRLVRRVGDTRLPSAPPLQRSRLEWGLPPPRAPSA